MTLRTSSPFPRPPPPPTTTTTTRQHARSVSQLPQPPHRLHPSSSSSTRRPRRRTADSPTSKRRARALRRIADASTRSTTTTTTSACLWRVHGRGCELFALMVRVDFLCANSVENSKNVKFVTSKLNTKSSKTRARARVGAAGTIENAARTRKRTIGR